MLLALVFLGCHSSSNPDPSDSGASPAGGDLACTASVSPQVNLVVGVEWTPPVGGTSFVEFGESTAYGMVTPSTDGSPVHLDLIGTPANTDVYWHGVTVADGATWGCSGVTTTGDLPDDLPTVEVATNAAGQDAAGYVLGAFFGTADARVELVAFRRDGAIVWYYEGTQTNGGGLDVHHARDGSGLYYNAFNGPMGSDNATIEHISFGGEPLGSVATPNAHHTFTELPDGTLTYQRTDIRPYTDPSNGETNDWVGDALVEIPPGGSPVDVFSVWDWLTPSTNAHTEDFSIYGGIDWTHGNLVTYDSEADRYLLSLAHAADILDIDRGDMTPVSTFGPDGVPANPPFDYQHGPNRLDDGNLLMFMTDETGSGAIEYAMVRGCPTEVWRYGFTQPSFALGQAFRLPNGDTFINYGAANRLQEVTPEGEVVWDVRGTSTGRGPTSLFAQFIITSNLYTGEP